MKKEPPRKRVNTGLAKMLKGGVIMDVANASQARIAQKAGAVAVMALERVPADIRAQGGVARMSDPQLIRSIQKAVSIPVMAKCRIGHVAEAQVLQALQVDYIDESEVLTPADDDAHIDKTAFSAPFVCGARNLAEAARRIQEGASMMRTKGEAGTGNIVEAVRHIKTIHADIHILAKHDNSRPQKMGSGRARAAVSCRKHSKKRPPAGGELCSGRGGHPRRRCASYADGGRWRVCR